MNNKKRIIKVMPILGSIITTIAFQLKLEQIEVGDSTILLFILNFAKSFKEYNIIFVLLIPALYCFYKYVAALTGGGYKKGLKICLSALFAFFIIMGYSYECTDSWDLVITKNSLQWLKVLISFSGYIIFFYYCISYIFYKIDSYNLYYVDEINNKKILYKFFSCFKSHPFSISFIILFLIYIPYIIVSYPAIFCNDMVNQIIQAYPELESYAPAYTSQLATEEGIYLNNHHPVVYTLLIHFFLELGVKLFSSYNIGIFICALLQLIVMLFSIAFSIQLLVKMNIRLEIVFTVMLYYAFSPRIQSYMFFMTKDVFYSAFLLLFITNLFKVSISHTMKDNLMFGISILGIMLFRNDGKYLLILSLTGICFLYKTMRKKMVLYIIIVILLGTAYTDIILPSFHVIPGSVREVLSIPFQQTARYLRESTTPISQEEKVAISAILDYDTIIEKYNPNISDRVKNTFNEKATKDELKEYFHVYIQMFFKHPSHYVQATMNNYYYYFYPGRKMADYWSYLSSEQNIESANDRCKKLGTDFGHPKVLKRMRDTYEQLREGIARLPIVSLLISTATYSWLLILLMFYCIRMTNREALGIIIPLCVQLLVCLAGPLNGWHFRYMYPIVVSLPIAFLISINLVKNSIIK